MKKCPITKPDPCPANACWLANPRSMRPGTPMPNFYLSDSEIQAIMAYLKSAP
ncbi:MAG: hypothetical protein HZC39_12925 [Chloroflexi bacterium]|nr:hypothetical protein [Chloroflexota bacterium]MBI5704429.1 hypothetical protein [Chloroflexota bacterium]